MLPLLLLPGTAWGLLLLLLLPAVAAAGHAPARRGAQGV
jgi:hypothetical protein